jgi:hypothetical protein
MALFKPAYLEAKEQCVIAGDEQRALPRKEALDLVEKRLQPPSRLRQLVCALVQREPALVRDVRLADEDERLLRSRVVGRRLSTRLTRWLG